MIACVLRSGGIYRPEHVQRLAAQAAQWAPGEPFVCLSDVPVPGVSTVPMVQDWPRWWAKLELFRPDVFPAGARVLYADLDTTVLAPIAPLLARTEPFLALRDFYRPQHLGSGLMAWTAGEQAHVYEAFAADAAALMRRHARHGDQQFIEAQIAGAARWQDVLPEAVVSYKVHCRHGVPEGARVVCFHGHPKPWQVREAA